MHGVFMNRKVKPSHDTFSAVQFQGVVSRSHNDLHNSMNTIHPTESVPKEEPLLLT
jgi:hypothetical protein